MKRILMIEDDQDILDVMGTILEREGFKVYTSANIPSVEKIIFLNCDLIISDHWVGSELGGELCIRLKSNPHTMNIPFLLVSAALNIAEVAATSGADAFIAKPFDLSELIKMASGLITPKSKGRYLG